MAEEATIVLETHIYSNPSSLPFSPGWTRSFHLRLSHQTATKSQLLSLVRASITRLGRADPIVEAQITLYWTSRTGRIASIPGDGNSSSDGSGSSMTTVTMPVWHQQPPPHLMTFNIGYPALVQPPQPLPPPLPLPLPLPQMTMMADPPMPLAMTYSNGVNYLHSYGNPTTQPQPVILPQQQPAYPAIVPGGQQTWIMGGGPPQLTFINVNVPTFGTPGTGSGGGGGKPVVSDVIREVRLDTIAEAALGGMLEWVCGPMGLKLIAVVDVDGRDVIPVVVSAPPPPAAAAAAVVAEPTPLDSPVAASPSPSAAITIPVAPTSPASAPASPGGTATPPPAAS
ncbi:hypothetical protein CFIO01_10609 [Colletotrichum fioriniae PJ7]|uniref:Uncharacterized protein n=1 Tax=Colletotrichum fioriniae PJ7 TaxID=1445577 RepID=A0A010R8P8_9PEZI|nr:hypothetical protein CFIO01_10609 [Colletotrichum fioriniae PJ7]